MESQKIYRTPEKKAFARKLRKRMTVAEKTLWKRINRRQLGLRFNHQTIFLGYILDFYCRPSQVAIEIDGSYHDRPKQKQYDKDREEAIRATGVKIIRFRNKEVIDKTSEVVEIIKTECLNRLTYLKPSRVL